MITLRYERIKDGVFVPHVDVMRSLNRTFRRAGIDVRYSNGFNHHMALKLTQPLPFGVEDYDGYATADVQGTLSTKEIFEKFSACCPPYITVTAVYETEKSPNLAGIVNASSYRIKGELTEEQINKINAIGADYEITMRKKGGTDKKAVGDMIYAVKADERGVNVLSAFGNVNLRVDLLAEQFNEDFGTKFSVTEIERRKQYIQSELGFISASEFLYGICRERFISKE